MFLACIIVESYGESRVRPKDRGHFVFLHSLAFLRQLAGTSWSKKAQCQILEGSGAQWTGRGQWEIMEGDGLFNQCVPLAWASVHAPWRLFSFHSIL